MSGAREPQFNQTVSVDRTPMPDHIPKVEEIGATSAPLLSAAFFIGARCRAYNDDYMKCKDEAGGRGELDCMREGRKVTRCAISVLDDLNKFCLDNFREHWRCLERENHQLWKCREEELKMNECVKDNMKLEKTIPGTPAGQEPIHLKSWPRYG